MKVLLTVAVFGALLTTARTGRADSSGRYGTVDEEERSYGGEIWFVSISSQTMMWVGGLGGGLPFFGLGAAGYLLGPPIVHWSRGNVLEGIGSLALHFGVPVAFLCGLTALTNGLRCGYSGCSAETVALGLLSMVVAMNIPTALDAAYLAYEEPEEDLGVWPVVTAGDGSASLGVSGRF